VNTPGFRSISELLAFIPGVLGMKLRLFWYRHTLSVCGSDLFVDWMAVIRCQQTMIGDRVNIGPHSWIGHCWIGDDCKLSGPTYVLSGMHTHGTERGRLIREQPVQLSSVRIGHDCWTGCNSVIGSHLANGTVVGAGSVVTNPTEPYSIVGGVPARKIGERQ